MNPRVTTALAVGLAVVLLTQDFVALELAADIGAWRANAPLADLIALALLPVAAWGWHRQRTPLPAPAAYATFLAIALLSALVSEEPDRSLHAWARKPAFMYLAYGVGLGWVVARGVRRSHVMWGIVGWALLTAGVSLVTSVSRIAAGDALWFHAILGLTPNHKTLAVALAGALPLVWVAARTAPGAGTQRAARVAGAMAIAAVGLSLSKTAWIMTAVGFGFYWPRGRPLSNRPKWMAPLLCLALATAIYAPVLIGSKTMMDAARSRHSLNKRAAMMVELNPLLGAGPGSHTRIEMVTFPHYRINGVDAHGVVQKVAGETGLLGLGAYGWFAFATGAALRRRARPGVEAAPERWAAFATWATLHCGLLLSTESFISTHWVPLAVAWGLSHRSDEAPG